MNQQQCSSQQLHEWRKSNLLKLDTNQVRAIEMFHSAKVVSSDEQITQKILQFQQNLQNTQNIQQDENLSTSNTNTTCTSSPRKRIGVQVQLKIFSAKKIGSIHKKNSLNNEEEYNEDNTIQQGRDNHQEQQQQQQDQKIEELNNNNNNNNNRFLKMNFITLHKYERSSEDLQFDDQYNTNSCHLSSLQQQTQQSQQEEQQQLHQNKNYALEETFEESNEDFHKHYKVISKIGAGQFGSVYKIQNIKTSQFFVAKEIISENNEEILMNEFKIAKSLNHQNIVNAEEYFFNKLERKLIFIFEYFEGENLYQLLVQNKLQNLTYLQKVHIMKQILEGLHHIHKKKIIHRDITLTNIMYNIRTNQVKIIDFGIAKQVNSAINIKKAYLELEMEDNQNCLFSPTGNPRFKAPELLNNKLQKSLQVRLTQKVDIFGAGLIFYSIFQNKCFTTNKIKKLFKQNQPLFKKYDELDEQMQEELDTIQTCSNSNVNNISSTNQQLEEVLEIQKIIEQMLDLYPDLRPTSYQILSHQIFQQLLS